MLSNPRFYVLASSVCMSIMAVSYLRMQTTSDQLFFIRSEQFFGYACLTYWYVALLVSPLQKQLGEKAWLSALAFMRRAIGVSAAYFALLHVLIALLGQMGGPSGAWLLPERFLWALVLGVIGIIILLLMAATSFNRVIALMTYPRWKWLHRLGYIGGLLVLIHTWMIGTHVSYLSFQSVIFILLVFLFGLESRRIADNVGEKYTGLQERKWLIAAVLWIVASGLLFVLPATIKNPAHDHALLIRTQTA